MKLKQNRGTIEILICDIECEKIIIVLGERIMKTRHKQQLPSFDELDADQLKELIQAGSGKAGSAKKSKKNSLKKTRKLPLNEEKDKEEYKAGPKVFEVDLANYKL